MMITANDGFIEQSERYSTDNAGKSLKKYILLKKWELAYNHGASKIRPFGSCFALTRATNIRIPFVYHCFLSLEDNPEFLEQTLNGKNVENQLRKIVSSGARMDGLLNISFQEYTSIFIRCPIRKEQDKIAILIKSLDHLITLHQSKSFGHILKVIVSCTLSWEQRKLGEIAERIVRKNEKLESTLPLTISAQYGLIDQNEFFDKRIASKDVRGYYLIKKGEFAYNKSTSVDAPLGAIKRLDKYKNGVLSTLYIIFKVIDDTSTSSDYLVAYYATDLWHRGIQSIAAEGARNHGLLNIAPNDFFETMLSIPLNISEQKKVGDFFISLDHLITLHQSKSFGHILKVIVSCTLSWEQRKFSELYELVNEKNDGSYGKDSNITVATMQFKSNIQISKNEYLNTYNIFKKGYIAFEGHKSKEFRFGRFVENDIGDGIVSHIFIVFRPIMEFDINFWKYAINNEVIMQSILSRATKASTMMNDLVVKDFLKEIFFVPSLGEQACIGKTLKSLDHLITLHQLEPYKLIFKAIAYRIIDYAKSKPPRCIK